MAGTIRYAQYLERKETIMFAYQFSAGTVRYGTDFFFDQKSKHAGMSDGINMQDFSLVKKQGQSQDLMGLNRRT